MAEAITRTVGEIIAERALGVLGESMTQQLLQQQLDVVLEFSEPKLSVIRAGSPPARPHRLSPPRPPGTSPPPISAGGPPTTPPSPPPGQLPPRPPGTSPPPISFATTTSRPANTRGVAVLEADDYLPAECVVLDEFLTSTELNTLRQYVLEQEMRSRSAKCFRPASLAEPWTMSTAGRVC